MAPENTSVTSTIESDNIQQLTAAEKAVLAEYQQASRDIEQQANGALRLMLRQRGLQGNWRLEGDSFVKAE